MSILAMRFAKKDELVLRREVAKRRPARQACAIGDVVHRRPDEAALAKELVCRREERVTPLFAVLLPSALLLHEGDLTRVALSVK